MPTTRSGVVTAEAISVTESADVLVARTVSGPTIDSSSEKSASFASSSSTIASITRSHPSNASSSVVRRQPVKRRRALVGRHALLVDLALEEMRDPFACLLTEVVGDLAAHGLVSRFDRELGDPGAHRPQTDNADRADLGNASRRAMLSAFPNGWARSANLATPARYLVDARVRACDVRERPYEHEEHDEEISEH